jgi:hypothetical protein
MKIRKMLQDEHRIGNNDYLCELWRQGMIEGRVDAFCLEYCLRLDLDG